jgi:multiple sugar transport system ATP-binding protein
MRISGQPEPVIVGVNGLTPPAFGQSVKVAVRDTSEVHLFNAESGARLDV